MFSPLLTVWTTPVTGGTRILPATFRVFHSLIFRFSHLIVAYQKSGLVSSHPVPSPSRQGLSPHLGLLQRRFDSPKQKRSPPGTDWYRRSESDPEPHQAPSH